MDIYQELVRLKKVRKACVLVTIVQAVGSAPQKEGAKMLIRDDGSFAGTLGGGCIEAEVIRAALAAMKDGKPLTVPFQLTEKNGGMICGGKLLVYIEPVIPEPHLIILGAGHVGRALSSLGRFSEFLVSVIDDRKEYANPENIPDAQVIRICDFDDPFREITVDANSYIVVATRGHNHDLDGAKAALHTAAGYIGLVGSRRKRAILTRKLGEEGFSEADIGRIITPAGLPIGSVSPEEIAVSIMAQIIQRRRTNVLSDIGHSSCGGLVAEDGAIKTTPSL